MYNIINHNFFISAVENPPVDSESLVETGEEEQQKSQKSQLADTDPVSVKKPLKKNNKRRNSKGQHQMSPGDIPPINLSRLSRTRKRPGDEQKGASSSSSTKIKKVRFEDNKLPISNAQSSPSVVNCLNEIVAGMSILALKQFLKLPHFYLFVQTAHPPSAVNEETAKEIANQASLEESPVEAAQQQIKKWYEPGASFIDREVKKFFALRVLPLMKFLKGKHNYNPIYTHFVFIMQ
jgi:hypothetical protein